MTGFAEEDFIEPLRESALAYLDAVAAQMTRFDEMQARLVRLMGSGQYLGGEKEWLFLDPASFLKELAEARRAVAETEQGEILVDAVDAMHRLWTEETRDSPAWEEQLACADREYARILGQGESQPLTGDQRSLLESCERLDRAIEHAARLGNHLIDALGGERMTPEALQSHRRMVDQYEAALGPYFETQRMEKRFRARQQWLSDLGNHIDDWGHWRQMPAAQDATDALHGLERRARAEIPAMRSITLRDEGDFQALTIEPWLIRTQLKLPEFRQAYETAVKDSSPSNRLVLDSWRRALNKLTRALDPENKRGLTK